MPKLTNPPVMTTPTRILFIWLCCAVSAVIGVFLAGEHINVNYTGFDTLYYMLIFDSIIVITAIIAAVILSSRRRLTRSDGVVSSRLLTGAMFISLVGVIIGVVVWLNIVKVGPTPPVYIPLMLALLGQIIVYFVAARYVLSSADRLRKRLWTPIVFIVLLILPALIFYIWTQK